MTKKYVLDLICSSKEKVELELRTMTVTQFKQLMYAALKEQDRDTRHACAEECIQATSKEKCHNICMNCRSGIKDLLDFKKFVEV